MALGISRLLANSSRVTWAAAANAASVLASSPSAQWNERFASIPSWICGPSIALARLAAASSSSKSVSSASAPARAASTLSAMTMA